MRLIVSARYFWSNNYYRPWQNPEGYLDIIIEPVKEKGASAGRPEIFKSKTVVKLSIANLFCVGDQINETLLVDSDSQAIFHRVTVDNSQLNPVKIAENATIGVKVYQNETLLDEIAYIDGVSVVLVPTIDCKEVKSGYVWVITAIALSFSIAIISSLLISHQNEGVISSSGLLNNESKLTIFAYVLLILALVASAVERIVEVLIVAIRKSSRLVKETFVEDAKRAWKNDRKNVEMRQKLLDAELQLHSFRSRTRLRTLSAGLVLGCLFGAFFNFNLFGIIYSEPGWFSRFVEIFFVGTLIAGGAEPLHDILKGFRGGIKNFSAIRSVK